MYPRELLIQALVAILLAGSLCVTALPAPTFSTRVGHLEPVSQEHPTEQLHLSVDTPAIVDEHHICQIKVSTNASHERVRVRQSLFHTAEVLPLRESGCYAWTAPPGVYLIEVDVFDPELGIDGQLIRVVVQEAQPDPSPDDDDPPEPTPSDAPFPAPGLTVLIIKEAKETGSLPEFQKAIFTSAELQSYLEAHCHKEDGIPLSRFWDDDYGEAELANTSDTLKTAYRATLQAAQGNLPWIAISDGKTGTSQPLPTTVEETLQLIKQYGGE